MASVLNSGSKGLGSSPGQVIVLCSWARHLTVTLCLSPTRSINWYLSKLSGKPDEMLVRGG